MKSSPETQILSFITIGLLIFLMLCPVSVTAIKVAGSIFTGSIAPGSSAVHTITVSTKVDDPPMDLMVDVQGLGQTLQQSSVGLSADKDTSLYSARTFITASPATFHLNPGESQEIKATITLPQNAGEGGRYALITIHNAPVGNGTTAIVTAVSVPIIVTIAGTPLLKKGTIGDVIVSDIVPGQPVRITTSLKNSGNYHYITKNTVTVTDSAGKVVDEGVSDSSTRSIIPASTVNYDVNIGKSLPPGTYTATSKVILEDGTVLDTKTTTFEVPANYIPPLQGASIKLTAHDGGVLSTPDGRVTINFPAGAVFSDTDVSLTPVAKDQAPQASAGITAASTSFKVDGINGLLAKDATVTVKYTSADLDAAKSDVSKLVLARYDDADGKWTLLPTTLDKSALTLSTATNRFGSWAVMVSSGGNTQGSSQGSTQGNSVSTGAGASKPGIGLDTSIIFVALGLMIVFAGIYRSRKL